MSSLIFKPLGLLTKAAFKPLLTGPLLFLLLRGPDHIRIPLLKQLGAAASKLITTLKYLFAIGAASRINKFLNEIAQNDWTLRNSSTEWNWKKEVVLITGGSSGFGAGVVKDLAAKGITVINLDIQDPLYDPLTTVHFYKCDITNPEKLSAIAAEIRTLHGNPTVLINNAGIGTNISILESSPAYIQKIFAVNILSHFSTIREFLPSMIQKNHGHVITIASMASYVTVAGITSYCCTKSAALAFHEGLRQELRYQYKAPNVKLSIFHPSFAKTPLIGNVSDPELNKKLGSHIMEASVVSDAITKQVLGGRSGQIIVPDSVSGATGLKGWPNWLQEQVRSVTSKAVLESAESVTGLQKAD